MNHKTAFTYLAVVGLCVLTACGSAAPKQIASSPADLPTAFRPIAREPRQGEILAYRTELHVSVRDVDSAAGKVMLAVFDLGGWVSNSQAWTHNGQKQIMMELSTTLDQYDSLRRQIRSIGAINAEEKMSEVAVPDGASGPTTVLVTVYLEPASFSFGSDDSWNLGRTFANAFSVISSIFHVLADIAIWLIVVGGPFVLIGLGMRFIIRRSRRTTPPQI